MNTSKQTPIDLAVKNVIRESADCLNDLVIEKNIKLNDKWLMQSFEYAINEFGYTFTTEKSKDIFILSCRKQFRKDYYNLFTLCYNDINERVSVTYNM